MEVGLLSLGDLITDPVTGARRSHAQRHRNLVEQAVAAEAVGFTSVHLGEHHFCDYILSAPPVVLAAICRTNDHAAFVHRGSTWREPRSDPYCRGLCNR
jgi:Luciferase-like monooxygenase